VEHCLLIFRNLQPCLAQSVEQVIDGFGIPPFRVVAVRPGGEIGEDSQHFLNRSLPGLALAKLAERRRAWA
jgi:hypothetical protein